MDAGNRQLRDKQSLPDTFDDRSSSHKIDRLKGLYSALSLTNDAMVGCKSANELLQSICSIAVSNSSVKIAWIGALEDGSLNVAAFDGIDEHGVKTICKASNCNFIEETPDGSIYAICNDLQNLFLPKEYMHLALKIHLRSFASFPVHLGYEKIGAIFVYSDEKNYFDDEAVELFVSMARDISYCMKNFEIESRHKQTQGELNMWSSVLEDISEGICVVDTDIRILSINKTFSQITGYKKSDVLGRNPKILSSGKQDRNFYAEMYRQINEFGRWQGEIYNRRKNGEIYPQWLNISKICDGSANAKYVAVFSDISKQKETQSTIERYVHFDSLTGLPNRLLLQDRLSTAISNAKRLKTKVGVITLNLDRFSIINDSFGFDTGDAVLQKTAKRLKKILRESDTVSRIERDHFVMIMCNIQDGEVMDKIAHKMIAALKKPFHISANKFNLTGSIGISIYPDDGECAQTILRNANIAMSSARECGRNTHQFYTQTMNSRTREVLELENALHGAIENKELRLYYQPQLDLKSGKTVAVEALLRWEHPKYGLLYPGKFISIAEETGLIIPIGEWVLKQACKDAKKWHEMGFDDICVAVNVSVLQFRQKNFVASVREILQKTSLKPRFLELELTESLFMDSTQQSIELLNNLKSLGAQLSIDDFGTGYCGFRFLQFAPIGKLKIDQSFISKITHDYSSASIVQAILAMAKSLGLKTIAEGVETKEQMEYLKNTTCDEIQGFLISRALPSKELTALLVK